MKYFLVFNLFFLMNFSVYAEFSDHIQNLPETIKVKRYFYNQNGGQTFGTFFQLWGGWATAAHVLSEMNGVTPKFISSELNVSKFEGYDIALIGSRRPNVEPSEPIRNLRIKIYGYPAGSRYLEERLGYVYIKRSDSNSWIAMIDSPSEPVVVGMSGGLVVRADTNEPIGVLTTRNSPADVNGDGIKQESADFVALSDIYPFL